jgi:hypothetical protein
MRTLFSLANYAKASSILPNKEKAQYLAKSFAKNYSSQKHH